MPDDLGDLEKEVLERMDEVGARPPARPNVRFKHRAVTTTRVTEKRVSEATANEVAQAMLVPPREGESEVDTLSRLWDSAVDVREELEARDARLRQSQELVEAFREGKLQQFQREVDGRSELHEPGHPLYDAILAIDPGVRAVRPAGAYRTAAGAVKLTAWQRWGLMVVLWLAAKFRLPVAWTPVDPPPPPRRQLWP